MAKHTQETLEVLLNVTVMLTVFFTNGSVRYGYLFRGCTANQTYYMDCGNESQGFKPSPNIEIRRNGTSEDWNVFGQTLDRYASVHSQFLDLTPDNFVLK